MLWMHQGMIKSRQRVKHVVKQSVMINKINVAKNCDKVTKMTIAMQAAFLALVYVWQFESDVHWLAAERAGLL